jgi:tetratricopeptide (TPR) repeat protein
MAEKAVQIDDSSPYARRILGFMAFLNKDYEKAIAELERAIALEPNSVAAHYSLCYFLYSAGRTEEAIPILKKGVALSPIHLPRALSHLCIASRKAGRYEKAVAFCKQLLQREPNHVLGHLTLAADGENGGCTGGNRRGPAGRSQIYRESCPTIVPMEGSGRDRSVNRILAQSRATRQTSSWPAIT